MSEASTNSAQELPELDQLASKILGIGGFGAFVWAQVGVAKSASALLLGYATYGAAIPLVGYAGLTVGAYALANYHFKRLGWDKAPADGNEPGGIPSTADLQKSHDEAKSAVTTLTDRIDELEGKLEAQQGLNSTGLPRQP